MPGSTFDSPGIRRGKLRARAEALVYEKNFLFLKRAMMRVGPLRRDGMGQVWPNQRKVGEGT